jgi:streptomycin 6-kinase
MIEVPQALTDSLAKHGGEAGRAFATTLPALTEEFLERWDLTPAGPPMHGWSALALPVRDSGGTESVLKLQVLDEETAGEPVALRAWAGDGAVRLLRHDPGTNTMLLEQLRSGRDLTAVEDPREAVRLLAGLLARLTALPAPAGLRSLGAVAAEMLDAVPKALELLADPDGRGLLADCAAAVREVAGEPGDRLLHWDLHYENVLAGDREPWLAIDPKPLAGDPGFDLMPALDNRFDPAPAEIRWRFDLLTATLGLDRERARAWTLARVLQNTLWDLEDGEPGPAAEQAAVARALLGRD